MNRVNALAVRCRSDHMPSSQNDVPWNLAFDFTMFYYTCHYTMLESSYDIIHEQ